MAILEKTRDYQQAAGTEVYSLASLLPTDAVKVLCESMVVDRRNDFINYYITLYPTHMDRVVIAQTVSGSHNVVNLNTGTIINTFERRQALSSYSHNSQLWCAIDYLSQTFYLRDWAVPRLLIFHEFKSHLVISTALMKDYVAIVYTAGSKLAALKATGKVASKSSLSRIESEIDMQEMAQDLDNASTIPNIGSIGVLSTDVEPSQLEISAPRSMHRTLSQLNVISNTVEDLASIDHQSDSDDSLRSLSDDAPQRLKNYTSMSLARDRDYMLACDKDAAPAQQDQEACGSQAGSQDEKRCSTDVQMAPQPASSVQSAQSAQANTVQPSSQMSFGSPLDCDDSKTPVHLYDNKEQEFTVAIYRISKSKDGNIFTAQYALEKVVSQSLKGSSVLGAYFDTDQTKLYIVLDNYEMYIMNLITYETELVQKTAYPYRFGIGHSRGSYLFNISSIGPSRALMLSTPISISGQYLITSNKECSTLYRNGKVYIEGLPPAACLNPKKPVVWFHLGGRFCELNLLKLRGAPKSNEAGIGSVTRSVPIPKAVGTALP